MTAEVKVIIGDLEAALCNERNAGTNKIFKGVLDRHGEFTNLNDTLEYFESPENLNMDRYRLKPRIRTSS